MYSPSAVGLSPYSSARPTRRPSPRSSTRSSREARPVREETAASGLAPGSKVGVASAAPCASLHASRMPSVSWGVSPPSLKSPRRIRSASRPANPSVMRASSAVRRPAPSAEWSLLRCVAATTRGRASAPTAPTPVSTTKEVTALCGPSAWNAASRTGSLLRSSSPHPSTSRPSGSVPTVQPARTQGSRNSMASSSASTSCNAITSASASRRARSSRGLRLALSMRSAS